jgi:hypothetical protein
MLIPLKLANNLISKPQIDPMINSHTDKQPPTTIQSTPHPQK